jgi:hypothetical protein
MRVLEEEAQHLACGVGPARVGVGSRRAAAGPGMPGIMHDPFSEAMNTRRFDALNSLSPREARFRGDAPWLSALAAGS